MINAAALSLPVFLVRLGATNSQVGLLTSMPGMTGLFLALVIGQFLQGRRQIVPWFSLSRPLVVASDAAASLAQFVVPEKYLTAAILGIWALATIPQTAQAVTFSVVMNPSPGRRCATT